jgi:hypothetical protein
MITSWLGFTLANHTNGIGYKGKYQENLYDFGTLLGLRKWHVKRLTGHLCPTWQTLSWKLIREFTSIV